MDLAAVDYHYCDKTLQCKGMVFMNPIPLNQLSKLFFALEGLGYPPIVRSHIELQGGRVDLAVLRQAYLQTVRHFPPFGARIADCVNVFGWQPYWSPQSPADTHRAVRFCNLANLTPEQADKRFYELRFKPFNDHRSAADPPFWMVLCAFPDKRWKLALFYHHALADGHGYSMVLEHLFNTYNHLTGGFAPPPVDPIFAPVELLPSTTAERFKGVLAALGLLAKKTFQQQMGFPAKLLYGQGCLSGRVSAVQRALDPEKLQQYLKTAKKLKISFTSLFVAAQATALERWKTDHNEPCRVISPQIHQDLRTSAHDLREVQNKISVVTVPTLPRHRQDLIAFARHIHACIAAARRDHLARKLSSLLWLLDARIVRALLKLWGPVLFTNPKFGDSFQVSNTGRQWVDTRGTTTITHLGNAEITALYLAVGPPVPSQGTFTGLTTYRNALFISFTFFEWAMPAEVAESFVGLTLQVLDELVSKSERPVFCPEVSGLRKSEISKQTSLPD